MSLFPVSMSVFLREKPRLKVWFCLRTVSFSGEAAWLKSRRRKKDRFFRGVSPVRGVFLAIAAMKACRNGGFQTVPCEKILFMP